MLLTKSKAATFRLFESLSGSDAVAEVVDGSYLPTRSVLAVFASGPLSCHATFSGGFCDAGVKNEETVDSNRTLISSYSKFTGYLVYTGCVGLQFSPQGWR